MAESKARPLTLSTRVASVESSIHVLSTYSSDLFGIPFGFTTSKLVNARSSSTFKTTTRVPVVPAVSTPAVASASPVSTRKSDAALTTTVVSEPDGKKATVVGSMIPLSTFDANGNRIRSGVANARTTVPVEPTALATNPSVESPDAPSMAPGSDATTSPVTPAAASSSRGLSSGQIAAAVVVPVLALLAGAILCFFLLRRRKRRREESSSQPWAAPSGDDTARGMTAPAMQEKKQHGMPFITSTTQHNYNTGLDSVPPSTTSGSGLHGTGTTASALPLYGRNQYGGSNLSNPFTDGSGSSMRKGSDAFAGFSGAGTERSSSSQISKGSSSPARAMSPSRAVSPVAEVAPRQPGTHARDYRNNNNDDDDDDAVSDISDDADVQVAQAHMGRAHRASVITMRGMGSNSASASSNGSPNDASPLRDARK